MKSLIEIEDILRKSSYIKFTTIEKNLIEDLKFLSLGGIFQENIKKEWLQNRTQINIYPMPTITGNENNLTFFNSMDFLKSPHFREDFSHIKQKFQKEFPFAMKHELASHDSEDNSSVIGDNEIRIKKSSKILLSCCYLLSESAAREYFFKIQRERKIWWMRFSSNPGRYSLTDLKTENIGNHKMQSVKIKSRYNFGDHDLETIEMIPMKMLNLENQTEFILRDEKLKKRVTPTVIRTKFFLEHASVNLLLDSTEESRNGKLNIHRKIAPYQCALFSLSNDEKHLTELQELTSHLTYVLRKVGINCLNLQKCSVKEEADLRREIGQLDKIGVPYEIILEEESLRNGLMKLRNRDTTISEVIHISDVPDYLLKIFYS